MPGFLASRGQEFDPGPVTRLDHSEFLCNKVLLKCKREKACDTDIRGGRKSAPLLVFSRKSAPLLVFSKKLYTYQQAAK